MKFRPLFADEIEVKVKQVKENGSVFLLYKTARTDMDLLDETVGPENWQCDYQEIKGNMYCAISIWSEKHQQWIRKQDCGIESREDGDGNEKKGEASDAFKRAGFKWGIGRELYTAPFIWVSSDIVKTKAVGNGFRVSDPFAKFYVAKIEYAENGDICELVIKDNKRNTVFTYGKNSRNEPITVTPAEKHLSEQCENKIRFAKSSAELIAIYHEYASSEPIKELKEACAVRRDELESSYSANSNN